MSNLSDNLRSFRDGIKHFRNQLNQQTIARMYECAEKMIRYAIEKKKWSGFTGNAQTSFTIGIYENGTLIQYLNGEIVTKRRPLMRKIKKGKRVFLKRPFEGISRAVRGEVTTANQFGAETALDFLKSYNASKRGLSMVVTIGVEYYMYLGYGDIGVLSSIYNKTTPMLNKFVFKQIKI